MTPQEVQALPNDQLVHNFQRAAELDVSTTGNGKNPFNKEQLKEEILKRLNSKPVSFVREEREVGDGHDEFS